LHLNQILWNLCENSITHNRDHDTIISIGYSVSTAGAYYLEVADNGIGIPENQQHNIFEPFFTTEESGTGLGLYIIPELCELNHASIELIVQEQGSCFRITLPSAQELAA